MKTNADKCHRLVSSNEKKIKIGSYETANTKREKLLGYIRIVNYHLIMTHQRSASKKSSPKICALAALLDKDGCLYS